MVSERLRNNTSSTDDAFDIFGKHIAAKLRTLPKQTKLYTEKLINDLLFEAEMGNVDGNTKIVTLANTSSNLIGTNLNIMVTKPRNYNNPYLQTNEYSRPNTFHPIHQQVYQTLENASAVPQSDTSISTFFGNYQPTEDNNL